LLLGVFVVFAFMWYSGAVLGNFALVLFLATFVTGLYWVAERLYFLPQRRLAAQRLLDSMAQRRAQLAAQGKEKTLNITVGAFDPEPQEVAQQQPEPQTGEQLKAVGLTVLDLTSAEKRELNLDGGAKVQEAQGAAARAGLRADDVILAVANTKVVNVNALKVLLEKTADKPVVSVLFRRGQWVQYALLRR
jgi:predicted metalloprotease with PDZ domain